MKGTGVYILDYKEIYDKEILERIKNTPSIPEKCLRLSVTVHHNLTGANRFYQWINMPAPTTL